jgi:hypothetical protein
MSARPGLCGGQPATAVPTAIVNSSTTVGQTCCFIAVGIVSCLLAIRTTCTWNTVEKEGAGEAPERAARRAAKGSSQRGPELIPPRQKGQFPGAGASIRPG